MFLTVLTDVIIEFMKLSHIELTKLIDIRFSSSDITGIVLSENLKELRGASLDTANALDIIKTLGVKVVS